MKKFTLSALAVVAAAVAAPAFAQSSVTLYGRLNTTVESQKTNNQGRIWVVANNASRIGFKGTEDIGGGLKAGFNLEHGFNSDNGVAATTFWGREANVNVSGDFGRVRLGRWTPGSYYATADYVSMHNHDTGSSEDGLYGGPFLQANKVAYETPTMGGFNASIELAAGEGVVKRGFDFAANYDMGPFHAGFGYSKQGDQNQYALRGLYDVGGGFTVGGYYQVADNGPGPKYKNARGAAMYALGASEFHVNYGRATNADQWTLGYNYNLSKRTKLYGYYTTKDTVRAVDNAGEFSSMAFGVRHNF